MKTLAFLVGFATFLAGMGTSHGLPRQSLLNVEMSGVVTVSHMSSDIILSVIDGNGSEGGFPISIEDLEKTDPCTERTIKALRSDLAYAKTIYASRTSSPGLLKIEVEKVIKEGLVRDQTSFSIHYSLISEGQLILSHYTKGKCTLLGAPKVQLFPSQLLDQALRD